MGTVESALSSICMSSITRSATVIEMQYEMFLFCQLHAKSHSYNVIYTKQVHACKTLRGESYI